MAISVLHALFWINPVGVVINTYSSLPVKFHDLLKRLAKKWKKPIEYSYGSCRKGKKIYRAVSICHPFDDLFSHETGETIVRGRISRMMDRGYKTYGVYKTIKKKTKTHPVKLEELPEWMEVDDYAEE